MTWYFSDLARFRAEQEAIEALSLRADWFETAGWRLDERVRLVLDAEILAGGRAYPVYLQYPEMFPYTPPSVFPRGGGTRWSMHQFGPGGELCLEYGPDNWVPEFTGVHLIESAYRLLEGENPVSGEGGVVPSRHEVSLGQKMRSAYGRMLLTRNLEGFLPQIPTGQVASCNLICAYHKESCVYIISKITLGDGTTWFDQDVPAQLGAEFFERKIPIIRIDSSDVLPATSSLNDFRASCAALGLKADETYIVILQGSAVRMYFLWEKDNSVSEIAILPAQRQEQRIDTSHEALKEKSVALIGCGSLGSKLATMLARSGVGRFLLVDDDILLPDNLVRNDLDWRDIGTHKAQGLERRLQFVNPAVETNVRRVKLGGQESSGSAASLLKVIGECDLVFDATANPEILNLVSAVAALAIKPVIWAEVFGGGIGGLIARCRPGIEPPPQYMRWAIENWFGERGSPQPKPRRSYETGGDGAPLIAEDADVSAIAAHATRLAIDTLLGREPSLFPHSAYAIGLGVGSVFSQPFQTFPIEVGSAPEIEPKKQLAPDVEAAEIEKLVGLFKARSNDPSSASQDNSAPQA